MGKRRLFAAALAFGLAMSVPLAAAAASAPLRCQQGIATAAASFFGALAGLERRCREAGLLVPGSCQTPDAGAIAKLRQKLGDAIRGACETSGVIAALGFPGQCSDPDPQNGFGVDDLVTCLDASHTAGAGALTAVLFDAGLTGPLTADQVRCLRGIHPAGGRFAKRLLRLVQRCRNDVLRGKIVGVDPVYCATQHSKTRAAMLAAERRLTRTVARRCSSADVVALRVCEPDQPTTRAASACLVAAIRGIVDDPEITHPPDLIDYEYATPPVCGDHRRNQGGEECDGPDDAACPGACGAPGGLGACLCPSGPHLRVVEHGKADLDLGWSGLGHDARMTEGGGWIAALADCDLTTDLACTVGPSCSAFPHVPCGSTAGPPYTHGDALCASLGAGTCRQTGLGAMGPHCASDYKQECASDAQCPATGDRCITTPHAPPLPLSQGGVAICVESVFAEDVVGSVDFETGAGAVRARQRLRTHLGPAIDQPCPVCGGFCAAPLGVDGGPGARTPCDADVDCAGTPCVTELVCSYGPRADQPCRPDPPFGGATDAFGTTSIDCPPSATALLSTLDVLANPATTGMTTLMPSVECTHPQFLGEACVGGANAGGPCLADVDCPAGTCGEQCFCPGQTRPNACEAACVGGANDALPCIADADCDPPNGFCHPGDCRPDPSDTDSVQEGRCTVGPARGVCSVSRFQPCMGDAQCAPPACAGCEPGELCVFETAQCFVSGGIVRAGTAGMPKRASAAVFCLAATGSPAVDAVVGLPGPGALTQPETLLPFEF